jgi:DNA-binding protein HU-beta
LFSNYSQQQQQPFSTKTPSKNPVVLNKRHIVEEIASTHDMTIAKSERVLKTVLDSIVDAVSDGKKIRLSNFGSFESYESKERIGVNPSTREKISIPAQKRIRFKAYDSFKKNAN